MKSSETKAHSKVMKPHPFRSPARNKWRRSCSKGSVALSIVLVTGALIWLPETNMLGRAFRDEATPNPASTKVAPPGRFRSFDYDIAPIFRSSCLTCHIGENAQG